MCGMGSHVRVDAYSFKVESQKQSPVRIGWTTRLVHQSYCIAAKTALQMGLRIAPQNAGPVTSLAEHLVQRGRICP